MEGDLVDDRQFSLYCTGLNSECHCVTDLSIKHSPGTAHAPEASRMALPAQCTLSFRKAGSLGAKMWRPLRGRWLLKDDGGAL